MGIIHTSARIFPSRCHIGVYPQPCEYYRISVHGPSLPCLRQAIHLSATSFTSFSSSRKSVRMHTACWTCRSRTIQCDQTNIPCAKCQKAGLECFEKRPLRWVRGVAIRGKMRGRVLGGDPKAINQSRPAKLQQKQTACPFRETLSTKVVPSPLLQDPCLHDLDWSSRFYLDYCVFLAWSMFQFMS